MWGKYSYVENSECTTQTNFKEYVEALGKMKRGKYSNKPPDVVGEQNILVNFEDASCSIMLGTPNKEWNNLRYTWLMFCQTLSQEVLQMDTNTYKSQEVFLYNKRNDNIICVGDNILYVANNNPTYGGKLS